MIYSCFNERLGLYEYFEEPTGHPVNGDLPIPKLPAEAGTIGVPARDAGRPLPPGAKPAGTGWHAKGMVVSCSPSHVAAISGLGGVGDAVKEHPYLAVGVAALAMYGLWSIYVSSMQGL